MALSGPNQKTYISTATTTQVTTAGETNWLLEGLQLWDTLAGTVKIYDDDNGTSDIFVDLPIGTSPGAVPMSVHCHIGIRVVTSDADKVLVVWRRI